MTNVPEQAGKRAYGGVPGGAGQVAATVEGEAEPAPPYLTARRVRLTDGSQARQLRIGPVERATGYRRLDNEILAGLRLCRLVGEACYPPEVSRLIGYEADSAEPFALLEPYRGEPLAAAARRLLPDEQHRFQASLLRALCWLTAAGIAHRGIGPSSVRWDGEHVRITDFSLATVIGAPREVIGALPWAAPEQRADRAGQARGDVSSRDDVWAAGRLIHYVLTGEELSHLGQVADVPGLEDLLAGVFGPPEGRPTAAELLTGRLRQPHPVPRGLTAALSLEDGRAQFYAIRARKHPGLAAPGPGANPPPQPPHGTAPAAARSAVPHGGHANRHDDHAPPAGGLPGRTDPPQKTRRRPWFPRGQESALTLPGPDGWTAR